MIVIVYVLGSLDDNDEFLSSSSSSTKLLLISAMSASSSIGIPFLEAVSLTGGGSSNVARSSSISGYRISVPPPVSKFGGDDSNILFSFSDYRSCRFLSIFLFKFLCRIKEMEKENRKYYFYYTESW